jgi:aryl carrier-like protein
MYVLGNTLEHWTSHYGPIPSRESSPFHFLSSLRALKKVELYGTPAYQADIEQLLANSPIEELRLDVLPDGLASLRVLEQAKSLRKLHVSVSYFGEEAPAARSFLESLPVTELSLGPPADDVR